MPCGRDAIDYERPDGNGTKFNAMGQQLSQIRYTSLVDLVWIKENTESKAKHATPCDCHKQFVNEW